MNTLQGTFYQSLSTKSQKTIKNCKCLNKNQKSVTGTSVKAFTGSIIMPKAKATSHVPNILLILILVIENSPFFIHIVTAFFCVTLLVAYYLKHI